MKKKSEPNFKKSPIAKDSIQGLISRRTDAPTEIGRNHRRPKFRSRRFDSRPQGSLGLLAVQLVGLASDS